MQRYALTCGLESFNEYRCICSACRNSVRLHTHKKEQQNNAIMCVCGLHTSASSSRSHQPVVDAHNRIRRVRQPYGVYFEPQSAQKKSPCVCIYENVISSKLSLFARARENGDDADDDTCACGFLCMVKRFSKPLLCSRSLLLCVCCRGLHMVASFENNAIS